MCVVDELFYINAKQNHSKLFNMHVLYICLHLYLYSYMCHLVIIKNVFQIEQLGNLAYSS